MRIRTKNKLKIRKEGFMILGSTLMVGLLLGSSLTAQQRTMEVGLREKNQTKFLGVRFLSRITVSGGSSLKSGNGYFSVQYPPKDGTFTGLYELKESNWHFDCPPKNSSYPRWSVCFHFLLKSQEVSLAQKLIFSRKRKSKFGFPSSKFDLK